MDMSDFVFGAASVGSRVRYADFVRLAERAYGAGINRFDTAPQYGRGLAQVFVQRYLADHPHADIRVSSKLGRLPVPDIKTLLIVLSQGEFQHVARLMGIARGQAADFREANLRQSLQFTAQSLPLDRVDALFLHSSPAPVLAGGVGALILDLCQGRFRPGVAEPCADDLQWLMRHEPQRWLIQVSAQTLLSDPGVRDFPGQVWINSIIRHGRKHQLSMAQVLDQLATARPKARSFVVGFNHEALFDELVGLGRLGTSVP